MSIKRKTKKNPTPYESGIAMADTYIASLHPGIHKVCSNSAHAILGAHATYYQAYTKYMRDNNKAFIPNACGFKLEL